MTQQVIQTGSAKAEPSRNTIENQPCTREDTTKTSDGGIGRLGIAKAEPNRPVTPGADKGEIK